MKKNQVHITWGFESWVFGVICEGTAEERGRERDVERGRKDNDEEGFAEMARSRTGQAVLRRTDR